MIHAYSINNGHLFRTDVRDVVPKDTVWLEVSGYTQENKAIIQSYSGVDISLFTNKNRGEIFVRPGLKSQVYIISADFIPSSTATQEQNVVVIYTQNSIITFTENESPFSNMISAEKFPKNITTNGLLIFLMEGLAKITSFAYESIESETEMLNKELNGLPGEKAKKRSNEELMELKRRICFAVDTATLTQDCIETLRRITISLSSRFDNFTIEETKTLKGLDEELSSLGVYGNSLIKTIEFLQESATGSIIINQNEAIEILTVILVIFTPPGVVLAFYDILIKEAVKEEYPILSFILVVLTVIASSYVCYKYFIKKKKGE